MSIDFDSRGFWFAARLLIAVFLAVFIVKRAPLLFETSFMTSLKIDNTIQKTAVTASLTETGGKPIKLAFVGDIMLDRGVKESIKKNGNGDFFYPFFHIADDLQKYDILFGNLEGPISERGEKTGNKYSFKMSADAAEGLASAGFDILSLANNHMGDWGWEAIYYTLQRLKANNILTVGAGRIKTDAYAPSIISVGNARIAYLAFVENAGAFKDENNVVAKINEHELENGIKTAKQNADIVIVYFHFGEEYKTEPNAFQRKISRFAIDAGADLVVGSHPHVAGLIEKYKDAYIAYSLGNFIFDQDFSEETMRGLLLEAEIENKKIVKITPKNIQLNSTFQPSIVNISQIKELQKKIDDLKRR